VNKLGKLSKFAIDMPFTWILWKTIEEIEQGNSQILKLMDDESLQLLSLNIMP
jgi:hypothetical protein